MARALDFYVDHVPGRDELHLEREYPWYDALWKGYYDERDASVLVREPCLAEPATYELLAERMERSLAARGGNHGLCISLGDEVGLTPYGDPLDLCACETCRKEWETFLAGELARLGLELDPKGVPYPSTDEARRAWIAGDASLLGPWLARRRFHQEQVLALLRRLAARARELAPGTPIGLMGLAGRTAFGGVAVERALEFLDVLEPYPTGDARELAYTLRRPEQRILRTIFPEEGSTHGPAWQVWEHFVRGGDGVVIWCDRDLERDKAYLECLARAVRDVRKVREQIGAFRPGPRGVALLHSPDSIALSWLRESFDDGPTWPRRFAGYHEEHGAREIAVRAWLRLCEDSGFLPGSIPIDALGADTAKRFPLLIASHVSVVGQDDEARISAYLEAGGYLVIHGPFARYDAWGRAPAESPEERFEELAPEHVQRLPDDISRWVEGYLKPKPAEDPAATTRLAAWLRDVATVAGAAPPVWRISSEEAACGWLLTTFPGTCKGEWIGAVLPNVTDRDEHREDPADARDLCLTITLPAGWSAVWIHPPPTENVSPCLPAGDAGVVLLRSP